MPAESGPTGNSAGIATKLRLADRLTATSGRHYVPGMQALVRLPLDVARRDRAAGLRTGVFISGYPGSPLGGYDLALEREAELLAEHGIVHVPAGNEEQAATACMGTQMLEDYPHSRVDGVTAFWYGKGPGVDRSGDALKHGNFAGTSPLGAVVLLVGDDHEAKSSTMPYQEEPALASAGIPVLYPASVTEFRSLGLHAAAMSRYSGCWVALKLTNPLCDGGETVDYDQPVETVVPDLLIDGVPFAKRTDFSFYPGKNIEHERHLYEERHVAVQAYARANQLDRVEVSTPSDTIGIVAAGKSWTDVRQALTDLGIGDDDLRRAGVRLLKLSLVSPLDAETIRDFADGLEEIVVIEEKRPVVEDQVRAAVQPLGRPLRVVGKRDETGARLLPSHGAFGADQVATVLAGRLQPVLPGTADAPRLKELAVITERDAPVPAVRTPNFCSGCPHNTSTVLAEGQQAWGAPGCGCFGTVIEQPERHIDTMTQYGGEGLPWVGLAPFTDRPHLTQHVGDGSFYHSSHLNIRWAVATGTTITFKILYNGAVANTGAQSAPGQRGVPALTRLLEAEGVAACVVVTKEPRRYRRQRLGRGTTVRRAHELVEVSRELERVPGVTVLVYDETCANERRRQRKRGIAPPPEEYVVINPDVCEACGDCGAASNCMSLQKVDTEFGPKTHIHTSSCNQDLACLKGDCPSFVTVRTAEGTGYRKPTLIPLDAEELPEVAPPALSGPFGLMAPGVGGTGVLTLNAMLAAAATVDGHRVRTYDQTGAAQKWGPVLSTLLLHDTDDAAPSNVLGAGRADLLLALDEVGSVSPANQRLCSPERTALVLNTDLFPTGEMVRDVHATVDRVGVRTRLEAVCRPDAVEVPARRIAETLFGDYMVTNLVAVGAAYQAGLLPLSAAAIEEAIALNGVAVTANTQALRYGRLWIADPQRVRRIMEPPPTTADEEIEVRRTGLPSRWHADYDTLVARVGDWEEPVRRLLAVRIADLIGYQDARHAERYLDRIEAVRAREQESFPGSTDLTEAVAVNLHRVLAYKDEYEVARLHLQAAFREQVAATFTDARRLTFHLAPPALRRFGYDRKVAVPGWAAVPAFGVLRGARRLRGTKADPFGRQRSRVEERALIDWYTGLLDTGLAALRPLTRETVLALARLPEQIRGYEDIKAGNAAAARDRAERLLGDLTRPRLSMLPVAATRP
ncbi:indolepyruvate ferredoxin oxidoreductase family protein [Geodermatophilus sp. SYSU D00705]